MSGRGRTFIAMGIGLLVGAAYPLIDLFLSCRAPTSEACVWGKSLLPLTLGVSIPLIGGVAAVLAYVVLSRRR